MDTIHLERALRAIPMGQNNWLFCWTEVGARYACIVQSLIVTCRLHGIDPYTYFGRRLELTPRIWKQYCAHAPLRSDLHAVYANARPGTPAAV